MQRIGRGGMRGLFSGVAAAALAVVFAGGVRGQETGRVSVATFYGPVSVSVEQALKACVHNVAARGRFRAVWRLLDNATGRAVGPERASSVDVGGGACELFLPAAADTYVVMLEIMPEGPGAAGGVGQHEPGALPSLQVTNRGGTSAIALLLPAVQKVREAAGRF